MDSEYMAYLYLQGYTGSDNSNQYPVGEGDIDDSSTWELTPVRPPKGVYESFIHKSRYARYLWDEGRRETWEETVLRMSTSGKTRG